MRCRFFEQVVLESEGMPEESKGKMTGTDFHKMGDVQSCSKKG